jgi:hypothetical protein
VTLSRKRSWTPTDRAMAQLLRLVLAEDWHPATASEQLREAVPDPVLLRRMAGRVRRASAERDSEVADRAALTLDLAMDRLQPA